MAEGKSESQSKIRYEQIADMGSGLIIARVPAECIREQDINARIMKNEMQRQLTDNIKKRGQLESLPFCALTATELKSSQDITEYVLEKMPESRSSLLSWM